MDTSQTRVTRAVRSYMAAEGKNQSDIARMLGTRPGVISNKLNGQRRWSLDNVDDLRAAGVPVPLDHVEVSPL